MAPVPDPCGDLWGTVGAVLSWANLVVVVRPGRPEARIHVNGETAVTVDGRRAHLSEVRPGQRVRIRFDVVGDAPVATEIVAERA
ncbi:MAG TPA: hypothetical protein VFK90_13445 [Anaeromyxobacter sp.]|nr:hypothetical protein [Anaeromyxobacter sp.]